MKSHINAIIKFIIGWPLAIIALLFILKIITPQFNTLIQGFKHINLYLLFLGVLCFILFYFLRSYIWHRILKMHGYTNLPFRQTNYFWTISELKRYIPGNIWSFLGRTLSFSAKGIPKKDIGKFLIFEAQIFVISTAAVSLLAIPFLLKYFIPHTYLQTIPGFYALFLLFLLSYLNHKHLVQLLPKRLSRFIDYILPGQTTSDIVFLLFIGSIAIVLFGLGNYLILSSYNYVNPQLILPITGLFALSFLLGYLSFLTPAGFGIREGLVTLGLSKIMPVSIAGFLAILTRLVLILSELIYIAFSVGWYRTKTVLILNFEHWVKDHKQEVIIIFLFLLYVLYFTTASFLRYDNFYTGRFDLGNMAQTVWNTSRGRIFLFTNPNGTEVITRLAFHADFILILLAPLYFFWSDPRMLLLIQTLMVAGGVFFIYLIAKDILKSKNLALTFSFLYLLNPSIQRANLFDFHAVTLAILFLPAVYYFYRLKKYWYFLLFAVLAALTKEEVWLIIALFGVFIFLFQKRRLLGGLICFLSLGIFYYILWYAIPHALGSQHFALSYYAEFGDAPTKIIKTILFSPSKTFGIILEPSRLNYLRQLFLPVGFLSIFSPWYLLFAVPDLLINLLSNNSQLHEIYYQYTATISPFIFIAAIYGLRFLKKITRLPNYIFICYLLFASLYSAYSFGPLPGTVEPNIDMLTRQVDNRKAIDKYLSLIPRRDSVSASNNIGSHLSQRQRIYTVPLGIDKADVIVFLLTDPNVLPSLQEQKQLIQKLKNDDRYEVVVEKDKFIVFIKKVV